MIGEQFKQTTFVLDRLKDKKNGFYVDFGAFDGIHFSNTMKLEKEYDWKGILVEADPQAHDMLRKNRPNSFIDTRAVWKTSGEKLEFVSIAGGKLSGVKKVMEFGHPKTFTRKRTTYEVETVSLTDLMNTYDAPNHIDFLSIDVEGSELSILEGHDFSRTVSIWCIEHWLDYEAIKTIMADNGYIHFINEAAWWQQMNRCIESYFLHPDLVTKDEIKRIQEINAHYENMTPVDPKDFLRKNGFI